MNRYFLKLFLTVAFYISAVFIAPVLLADDAGNNVQINTPEKAAEFASKLANEKCSRTFGVSPFTPESYSARLLDSKWCWGKIEPPGIHGYSAEVEFNSDGSDQKVRIVFHTDKNNNAGRDIPELEMEIINQEEAEALEKKGLKVKEKP